MKPSPPRRVVPGYRIPAGAVLAVANFIDKQPSRYWGTTQSNIVKSIHARLKELCEKWDRGSVDKREAGVVFQSDGEIDVEGMLTFEVFVDATCGRSTPQWVAHRVVAKPVATTMRRALGTPKLRLILGDKR